MLHRIRGPIMLLAALIALTPHLVTSQPAPTYPLRTRTLQTLDTTVTIPAGRVHTGHLNADVYGTTGTTACVGNDARLPPAPATAGRLVYDTGATYGALADVAAGSVLVSGGVGAAPSYSAAPTVTTLATTNLTFTPAGHATGDTYYDTGAGVVGRLADVAAGSYLRSGGAGVAPAYSTTTLPNTTTQGDVLTATGANAVGVLGAGTAGQLLRTGGAGANATWTTATYPNTVTQGDLVTATGANALGSLADVAVGQVLTSGGVGAAPAYSANPTVTSVNATTVGADGAHQHAFPTDAAALVSQTSGDARYVQSSVLTTRGDLLVANATPAPARLALGGAGSLLRSNGTDPAYTTVTYADSYARGAIPVATGANVIGAVALGASGTLVSSNGTDTVFQTPLALHVKGFGAAVTQSYALTGGAHDYTLDGNWNPASSTDLHSPSSDVFGDGLTVPIFWVYHRDLATVMSLTTTPSLRLGIGTNTGSTGPWPRADQGAVWIAPLPPDAYQMQIDVQLAINNAVVQTVAADVIEGDVGILAYPGNVAALPYYEGRVALSANQGVNPGGAGAGRPFEYVGYGGVQVGAADTQLEAPADHLADVVAGVLVQQVRFVISGSRVTISTGAAGGAVTQRGNTYSDPYVRGITNPARALVLGVTQQRGTPNTPQWAELRGLSITYTRL